MPKTLTRAEETDLDTEEDQTQYATPEDDEADPRHGDTPASENQETDKADADDDVSPSGSAKEPSKKPSQKDEEDEGGDEPHLDEGLVAIAETLGVPRDLIEGCKNESALGKLVAYHQKLDRDRDSKTQPQPGNKDDEDEIKLDPELVDESIVKAVSKQSEKLKSQSAKIRELETALGQQRLSAQMEAEKRLEHDLDKAVASLGEDYADLLGEGPTGKLPQNSPQYKARRKLFDHMDTLATGIQAKRRKLPPLDELAHDVAPLVFPEKIRTKVTKDLEQKIRARSEQIISPPSTRKNQANTSPRQKALAGVVSKLREMGGETDEF